MSLRPLADQVLIRRHEVDERQAGGIIIPDTAKDKHAGTEIRLEHEDLLVMRESDILGMLEG
jgi:chaperonin GroES